MSCGKRGDVSGEVFESIVTDYIEQHRRAAERELKYYRIQPSLERAIELAVLARLPGGKRHPHQRRIPGKVLEEAKTRLLGVVEELRKCRDFEELMGVVEREIGGIKGIGTLTVYDTAHRIGAYLGVEPEKVYLHAGTREGAKVLGLDWRKRVIDYEELPKPLRRLRPYEVEDVLCLYKDKLKSAGRSAREV